LIDPSLEDIDLAVRYGFGFHYVVCAPVRQRDLNGLVIKSSTSRLACRHAVSRLVADRPRPSTCSIVA
jgi:hypothetical protein